MNNKFNIQGMTCASCQSYIQKTVQSLNGVDSCNVNLLSNSMVVEYNSAVISANDICSAVDNIGYKALLSNSNKDTLNNNNNSNASLKKLIASIVLMLILVYVSMGHMVGLPLPAFLSGYSNALYFALVQLCLTIPVIIIYRKIFINGFKNLFKHPNMDTLIAIGSSASLIYGIFAICMIIYGLNINDLQVVKNYYHNLYFESAVMILTLVSLGKFLEEISKSKTTKSIQKLIDLAPKQAILLKDNIEIVTPIENICVNDIVIVKNGDKIPVDGVIIDGKGSIEEANLTGESMPKYKSINDKVYASTILRSGYLKVKALKIGADSSIENIIKLVDEASNSKAPISKLVDKVSFFFVPTIIAISLIVLITFLAIGSSFEQAFNFAISVLVIACPCSLGLATPVAIMVGSGKGAELGLLIKNAEILENAHFIKTILLDKTGTITKGVPVVTDVISENKNMLLNIAFSLEDKSEHPLAFAINTYAKNNNATLLPVSSFSTMEGLGVCGVIDNIKYYAGNLNLLKSLNVTFNDDFKSTIENLAKNGKTPLIFLKDNAVLGVIAVKDTIKDSSKSAVSILKSMGINVVMLTGDNSLTANKIASEVGIDNVICEVLPSDKMKFINKFKKNNKNLVAMVGDGVNDALALTSADIGIAIGAGSDVALDSADIVLIKNDLLDVCNIISLSKRVMNTIKVNLFWAFFYNCVGVILASGLFYFSYGISLNPMISSLAMSLSSLFVVLNALTINLFKPKKKSTNNDLISKSNENNVYNNLDNSCSSNNKNITKNNSIDSNIVNCNSVSCGIVNGNNVVSGNNKTCDSINNDNNVVNVNNNENFNSVDNVNNNIINDFSNNKGGSNNTSCNILDCSISENCQKTTANNNFNKELKMVNIHIDGMMCIHCVAHIKSALENLNGVLSVEISLEDKSAKIEVSNDFDVNILIDTIKKQGYDACLI